MCRVTITSILLIISAFIAELTIVSGTTPNPIAKNDTELTASRSKLRQCFNDIMYGAVSGNRTGLQCQTGRDMIPKFKNFFRNFMNLTDTGSDDDGTKLASSNDTVGDKNIKDSVIYTSQTFIELVDSMQHESFKQFIKNYTCVLRLQQNISECYLLKAGEPFNGTLVDNKYRTEWINKLSFYYSVPNCGTSREVKECIVATLQTECPDTVDYVDYAYNVSLSHCPLLPTVQNKGRTTTQGNSYLMVLIVAALAVYR